MTIGILWNEKFIIITNHTVACTFILLFFVVLLHTSRDKLLVFSEVSMVSVCFISFYYCVCSVLANNVSLIMQCLQSQSKNIWVIKLCKSYRGQRILMKPLIPDCMEPHWAAVRRVNNHLVMHCHPSQNRTKGFRCGCAIMWLLFIISLHSFNRTLSIAQYDCRIPYVLCHGATWSHRVICCYQPCNASTQCHSQTLNELMPATLAFIRTRNKLHCVHAVADSMMNMWLFLLYYLISA